MMRDLVTLRKVLRLVYSPYFILCHNYGTT